MGTVKIENLARAGFDASRDGTDRFGLNPPLQNLCPLSPVLPNCLADAIEFGHFRLCQGPTQCAHIFGSLGGGFSTGDR